MKATPYPCADRETLNELDYTRTTGDTLATDKALNAQVREVLNTPEKRDALTPNDLSFFEKLVEAQDRSGIKKLTKRQRHVIGETLERLNEK